MDSPLRRREQEVWHALDDLWATYGNARYLTGEAIRDRLLVLGKSKGSPNEIYKYRKTWEESRKVNIQSPTIENNNSDDPITRAARLVHDEIKQKAEGEILKIKEEFLKKEYSYKEEIKNIKENLDNLVEEFTKLERNYALINELNEEKKQKLAQEIENKKLLENEIAFLKEKEQTLQVEREKFIFELKIAHQNETAFLKETYKNALEKFEEEKKCLGAEYSESLNQVRVESYNQKLIIERKDEKIRELEIKVTEAHEKIDNLVAIKDIHIAQKEELALSLKKVQFLLVDKETKIARLRALNRNL